MKFRYDENRKGKICSFSDLFDDFLSKYELKHSFSFEALQDEWKDIAGPILSVHTRPVKLENKILYIASDHAVFSNDMIMMKGTVIEKVHTIFGEKIYDIRIIRTKGK